MRTQREIDRQISCSTKLAPLCKSGGTIDLEVFAAVEVTFLIEMIVNGGMDGDKFLQTSRLSETLHRSLSSSQRLM